MNKYFEITIEEAKKAFKKNEVPVGALIVSNDKIISKTHNKRQSKHGVLNHAEILCIIKAEKKMKDWRLDNCEMYVTLEPCTLCKKIIEHSRIKKVYYLTNKPENNKEYKKTIYEHMSVDRYDKENKKILAKFFEKMR